MTQCVAAVRQARAAASSSRLLDVFASVISYCMHTSLHFARYFLILYLPVFGYSEDYRAHYRYRAFKRLMPRHFIPLARHSENV